MVALLFILLTSYPVAAQQIDTLTASAVYSVKQRPVVKPAEEVRLQDAVAAPMQVADVLRRFTGVQVKDYGGVGGLKTVNVRSLGSEHVGVFLDGIQVDNAQNMQVDLGRFSTGGINTVSLYNGQKTSRLQTAKEYACGASVHLDSERPLLQKKFGGRARFRGGSFGTVNPSVQWDQLLGPVTLRASAEFLTSNGRYKFPCFDTTLVRENGDIRSLRLETQLFGAAPGGSWQLRLYSYGSERGFPGPVIRRALGFPFSAERQADQNLFAQGGWEQEWTERYSTAVRIKYANDYMHYDSHPEKNPMAMPYDVHYRQQSGYMSLAQSYVLSDPWSMDLSTDIQRNTLDSDVGQFVMPRRTVFTGALATRVVWDRFRAAAHLVYMGAWDSYGNPNAGGWSREDGFRDAWMPSVSLYYAPWDWLEIDSYVKRSYRLPSFNDLYYTQMGNSNLSPESAFQAGADLWIRGSKSHWSWDLRLSPYYNKVSDKIVAIPTSSQFRWTMLNIGIVDVTGVDIKTDVSYSGKDWKADLLLRYSFQQALDHSTPDSQTWGNQIPYIPLHSGSVDFVVNWQRWALAWDTSVTGERWSRSANTQDYRIAPWSISDINLSYRFGRPDISLSLSCNNIFDQPYQIVQGYPMPGRSFMAGVEYRF
ncbi:MAG: TonB-dependent receptor [Bacteroidales bacterium]|nr:TonB-dependent receptor [Bacteroidales bacterium]